MKSLQNRIEEIKKQLNQSQDIGFRVFSVANTKIGLVFLKSIINKELFSKCIVERILSYNEQEINLEKFKNHIVSVDDISSIKPDEILESMLRGKVCVLFENEEDILAVDIELYPTRVPSEPPTSAVIQGPREGFTENIKTNISLIRKRFPTENLKIDDYTVGKHTKTMVKVVYLTKVADKNIVKKIEKKLKSINIDGVVDSYNILEFLQDKPKSIFKQVGTSEKPDVVAGKILEGRVAIFVDGSPIALTVPFLFLEDIQNSNDYYSNHHYVSIIRVIRAIGILVASIAPGIYISLRLYHYKITPLKFIITIANSTQGLPFTPLIELLFILLLFQILYEVSLRLPRYLGLATSIVGALILGDTGVKAGLISPPGVIIIAMSIISVYTVPDQAPQLTVLRMIFLVIGSTLGLLGVVGGMVYFTCYLNSLGSYSAPYLAPFSPSVSDDFKDGIFKGPINEMNKRPQSFKNKNKTRLKKWQIQ